MSPRGKKKVKCSDLVGSVRARRPRPEPEVPLQVGGSHGGRVPRARNGVDLEEAGVNFFPRKIRTGVSPLNQELIQTPSKSEPGYDCQCGDI